MADRPLGCASLQASRRIRTLSVEKLKNRRARVSRIPLSVAPLSPRGRFLLGTERYSKESDRKDDCDCGATWRRDADTGLQIHALTPRRVQGTDAL